MTPSKDPTTNPTFSPSLAPTIEPTLSPTNNPSSNPTTTPSTHPTRAPSYNPTMNPSLDVLLDINDIHLIWSSSYDKIYINILNDNINLLDNEDINEIECDSIFKNIIYSKCSINRKQITIKLTPSSNIDIYNSTIIIKNNTIQNIHEISIPTSDINEPAIPQHPDIQSNVPAILGLCDDLILDARLTQNVGIKQMTYQWNINNISLYNEKYVIIPRKFLANMARINVELIVTTHYGSESRQMYVVTRDTNPYPKLELIGPNIISNDNNDNNVYLFTNILFDDSCVGNNSDINFEYTLNWSVNEFDNNNTLTVPNINLNNQIRNNVRNSVVIPKEYFKVQHLYDISVHLQCLNDFNCSVNDKISIKYISSNINCNIKGNEYKNITNISISFLENYKMELDGVTFTYDNDYNDKSHLRFTWKCYYNNSVDCGDIITQSNRAGIIMVDFNQSNNIIYQRNSEYSFTFIMQVRDINDPNRNECSKNIYVNIKTNNNDNDVIRPLLISFTKIGNSNNDVTKTFRYITNIFDNGNSDNSDAFTFRWHERDNLVDLSELNNNNTKNLIIKPNLLTYDYVYNFELTVQKFDDNGTLIAFGSSVITVDLVTANNNFTYVSVLPNCNGVIYDNITDMFTQYYSISVNNIDNSNDFGVSYKYNIDDEYLLYSRQVYQPFLNNILLPLGTYTINVVQSSLFDVSRTYTATCNIAINTDKCVSFINEVYSNNDNDLLLFQKTYILLDYMETLSDISCILGNINDIISLFYNRFISNDLCKSFDVVDISQIFSKILVLLSNTDENIGNITHIFDLIVKVFDPCLVFDNIDVNNLQSHPDSIINGNPKIYYNDIDITDSLSVMITNIDYENLVYSFIESVLKYAVREQPSAGNITESLFKTLEYTIYCMNLMKISTFIPGETNIVNIGEYINIESYRIDETNVSIAVPDINITIDSNNLKGRQSFFNISTDLSSSDVIVISLNNIDKYVSYKNNKCNNNIELYNKSVSINVLSDIDVSNLTDNINVEFKIHETLSQNNIDNYKCAWLNETTNEWESQGCTKHINYNTNTIRCSCSHLTIFSTIKAINIDKCNNDFINDLGNSKLYFYVNIVMVVFWGLLSAYIIYTISPFLVDKDLNYKHLGIFTLSLLLFDSLFYCISGAVSFVFKVSLANINIHIYTLILLLPAIINFILFSLILYSWYCIIYSMYSSVKTKKMLRMVIYALNAINIIIIILVYILIIFNKYQLLYITEITYCVAVLLLGIVFFIYGYKLRDLLQTSAKMTSNQAFNKSDWRIYIKVRNLVIVIKLYFIYSVIVNLYLIINPNGLNIRLRIIDNVINFIFIVL